MRSSFRAPARVNLIGDHTDYNEGFALPLAIDLECIVHSVPRHDDVVSVTWRDGEHDSDRYARAVADALDRRGRRHVGIDAEVTSTVPIGSGLASSAALEVALALALADAADFQLSQVELALACQEAEQSATGVPCGVMDQLASLGGRAGCALLLDCRSLELTPLPLPASAAIVVVHSGLPRTLAGSAYAERRRACERTAERLGLRSLRDATAAQVADDPLARHVVSENARVLAAVAAMRAGDLPELGRLLNASHTSLRDDFRVSTPELDELVTALLRHGAIGARLTGAGFGGCVVALTPHETAEAIADGASAAYRSATDLEPRIHICTAVGGAGRIVD